MASTFKWASPEGPALKEESKRGRTPWTSSRDKKKGRIQSSPKGGPKAHVPRSRAGEADMEELEHCFHHLTTSSAMDVEEPQALAPPADSAGPDALEPEVVASPTFERRPPRSQAASFQGGRGKLSFSETWARVPSDPSRPCEGPQDHSAGPSADPSRAMHLSHADLKPGRRILSLRRSNSSMGERKRKSSTTGDGSDPGVDTLDRPLHGPDPEDDNHRKLITPPKMDRHLRRSSELAVAFAGFDPLADVPAPTPTRPAAYDPAAYMEAPLATPVLRPRPALLNAALTQDGALLPKPPPPRPGALLAHPTPKALPPTPPDAGHWRYYPPSAAPRRAAPPPLTPPGPAAAALLSAQPFLSGDAMDEDLPGGAARNARDASPAADAGIRCRLEDCLAAAARDAGPPRRVSSLGSGPSHRGSGGSKPRPTPPKLAWGSAMMSASCTAGAGMNLFAVRDPSKRDGAADCLPDLDTYNERLRTASLRADVEAAERVWSDMTRQFVEPDQTALNHLLRCYVRSQQRDDEVFEADAVRDMVLDTCRRYPAVRPNQLTLNLLLSFYVHEIQRSQLGGDNLERIVHVLADQLQEVGLDRRGVRGALDTAQHLWQGACAAYSARG